MDMRDRLGRALSGREPVRLDPAGLTRAAVIFPFLLGPIVSGALYVMNKDKDAFIAGHAKQACAYQIVVLIVTMFLFMTIIGIPLAFLLMLAAMVYGVYAAYMVYSGKEFEYPVIAEQVKKIQI